MTAPTEGNAGKTAPGMTTILSSTNRQVAAGGRRPRAASHIRGDAGGRGSRRTEELTQNRNRDDEPDVDDTPDDVPTTPTVPSVPNLPVDPADDLTDVDLFIEANPDVVAGVSASGGFAFARSGDVIAVSGPDGAQIIHPTTRRLLSRQPRHPTPTSPRTTAATTTSISPARVAPLKRNPGRYGIIPRPKDVIPSD